MRDHVIMFAGYNAWANRKVYEAVAKLSEADFQRDIGAFFKSVAGTLNHTVLADRAWLVRLTGEGEAPESLDDLVYDTFVELREERQRADARLEAFCERLSEADLRANFRYRTTRNPLVTEQSLFSALAHVFNHQTHHRGELRALFTQLGIRTDAFDLMYYQREVAELARRVA
jgi:uncharacterized damage-inducible protein DinB